MTVQELLTAAMRRLGYLEATETARAADLDAVKDAANALIDGFRLDGLLCYRLARHVFNLTSGTASYPIGVGATFDVARPVEIGRAGVVLDPAATTPREVPIDVLTLQDYATIRTKTFQAPYPGAVYYDPEVTTDGYGRVYVYPVPDSSTPDLALYLRETVTEFGANDADLDLAAGYRRLLVTNIAVEAAPILGVAPSPDLLAQAANSRTDVMRANVRVDELALDLRVPGMGHAVGYDIERG